MTLTGRAQAGIIGTVAAVALGLSIAAAHQHKVASARLLDEVDAGLEAQAAQASPAPSPDVPIATEPGWRERQVEILRDDTREAMAAARAADEMRDVVRQELAAQGR